MAVTLYSIPVSNTLGQPIQLNNGGAAVAHLAAGGSQTLTVTFNEIVVVAIPPGMFPQQTPGNFTAHPGNLGYFQAAPGGVGVDFCFAPPNQQQTRVHFQ